MKSGGKSWWTGPYWKLFLHYYQASDSELTSVAVAYYWLISIFPLLMIMVNILPYFQIPVSNFLLTIKEFLPRYGVWCGRQDCPRSSDSTINWFAEFCRFICTLDLFEINGFPPKKPLTKPMGWPRVEALSPISWWVYLLVLACRSFLPLPCFLSMFGRMLLNLLKTYWQSDSPLFSYLQDFTGPLVYALIFAILVMIYYFLPK